VKVEVWVRARVPNLVTTGSKELILLAKQEVPVLEPGDRRRWTVRPELMLEEAFRRYRRSLPRDIRSDIESGAPVDLAEFLAIREGTDLEVVAVGYDSLTGMVGYDRKILTGDSFRDGRFNADQPGHSGKLDDELPSQQNRRRPRQRPPAFIHRRQHET
jgi:hypothetical protein